MAEIYGDSEMLEMQRMKTTCGSAIKISHLSYESLNPFSQVRGMVNMQKPLCSNFCLHVISGCRKP